jgi:hypothetical protein
MVCHDLTIPLDIFCHTITENKGLTLLRLELKVFGFENKGFMVLERQVLIYYSFATRGTLGNIMDALSLILIGLAVWAIWLGHSLNNLDYRDPRDRDD